MTKEMLRTLSTGDVVVNKDGTAAMIVIASPKISSIMTVEELLPDLDNWELHKSRLFLSDEDRRKIEEYHKKMKTMVINK